LCSPGIPGKGNTGTEQDTFRESPTQNQNNFAFIFSIIWAPYLPLALVPPHFAVFYRLRGLFVNTKSLLALKTLRKVPAGAIAAVRGAKPETRNLKPETFCYKL
jgi:hypothetical protein